MRRFGIISWLMLAVCSVQAQISVSGYIRGAEGPLAGATLQTKAKGAAATSDQSGHFSLRLPQPTQLLISCAGYREQTISIGTKDTTLHIQLIRSENVLEEVVISGTLQPISRINSPVPVEVYAPSYFKRNPTPHLFESLRMVNGLVPQINCNVCNTGDIQINGLEGAYTLVLIDGMPMVSALATVYGLMGIPNSMISKVEVIKGPASTLYGSEAIGGIINIITKKTGEAPTFAIDYHTTSWGEHNLDLLKGFKTKKWSGFLSMHYFNFTNRIDNNKDHFTDATLQDRISLFQKISYQRPKQRILEWAARYVSENRFGGEMNWTRPWRGTDSVYGETIYTSRIEILGRYDLPVPPKISISLSYNRHYQHSYYGTTFFEASQQTGFIQAVWTKTAGKHQLTMGLPLRWNSYIDNTPATAGVGADSNRHFNIRTTIPGIFVQNEWKWNSSNSLLLGLRYDYHPVHGAILTPRINYRLKLQHNAQLRLGAGSGYRVVNVFTEDHAALTGARKVVFANALQPEKSWNGFIHYLKTLTFQRGYLNLEGSAFYTRFSNKIMPDYFIDPTLIVYDNLKGHAISKGISFNAEAGFTNGIKLNGGGTWMKVYRKEKDNGAWQTLPQPHAPSFLGVMSASIPCFRRKITLDLTGNLYGPMHLPVLPNDFRPPQSPWFSLMNVQVSGKTGRTEWYGGVKNLLNFIPRHPIMRPHDPFNKKINDPIDNPNGYTFDPSYNYAPLQGIRLFAGMRYTLPHR